MIDFLGKASSKVLPDRPAKSFYLCAVDSLDVLPGAVGPRSENFRFLLAINASGLSNEFIFQTAEKLIEMGIVYLCAWGPDCERVQDDFDEANISGVRHIMTSWHANQTLEEAIAFFVGCAYPSDEFADKCQHWIVASVGNSERSGVVRAEIKARVAG
jgi:hypothetical protein